MESLKGIRTVLGVLHIVLSLVAVFYCIATWRKDDENIIDAEVVK